MEVSAEQSLIPEHLLSRLSAAQIERLYKKPNVVTLIEKVYTWMRENEPKELFEPKKPIYRPRKTPPKRARINEVRVFEIQEEMAKNLEEYLTEEELDMLLLSSEAAALLSAQHNRPMHPYWFNRLPSKDDEKSYAKPLTPADDIVRMHRYRVRDLIHKRVRREKQPSEKTEAAK